MADSPLVVNFIGGPGTGKSTLTAGVFSKLKWSGVNCELALEFAKGKVWEESLRVLEDQVYILGKQHHQLYRLRGQVDVVLTDSPLLLSLVYGKHWGDNFSALAMELFHNYNNLVYVVERRKKYNPKGRTQTEDKARQLDETVLEILERHDIPFSLITGAPESEDRVMQDVLGCLRG